MQCNTEIDEVSIIAQRKLENKVDFLSMYEDHKGKKRPINNCVLP